MTAAGAVCPSMSRQGRLMCGVGGYTPQGQYACIPSRCGRGGSGSELREIGWWSTRITVRELRGQHIRGEIVQAACVDRACN